MWEAGLEALPVPVESLRLHEAIILYPLLYATNLSGRLVRLIVGLYVPGMICATNIYIKLTV